MNGSNFHVLLVEDDSNDALLLQRAFRRAGLMTLLHIVRNGEEAMAYLKNEGDFQDEQKHPTPSLILLDLKLPGKSGLDVLQWMRKEGPEELRQLPVIILTSSRQTDDIDRAYDLGAHSYMAKPEGNFDGLAEMVQTLGREYSGS
jgi:CheY-like chemotaxis protein